MILFILILSAVLLSATAETILFGRYQQHTDVEPSAIEWIILDETDDAYLLLSRFVLDASRFGSMIDPCYWYNSDIRLYLNTTFLDESFSADERSHIVKTKIIAETNSVYPNSKIGKSTEDCIFLLSSSEVEKYLTDRIAYATQYAANKPVHGMWFGVAKNGNGTTHWWLRSVGITEYYAAFVAPNGTICTCGELVYAPHYGVRPALWVDKSFFEAEQ